MTARHRSLPFAVTATDLVKVYGHGDTAVRALDTATSGRITISDVELTSLGDRTLTAALESLADAR